MRTGFLSGMLVGPDWKGVSCMKWDEIRADWVRNQELVRDRWRRLTDEDVALIEGKQEILSGIIQRRYGLAKDEADLQIAEFFGTGREGIDRRTTA